MRKAATLLVGLVVSVACARDSSDPRSWDCWPEIEHYRGASAEDLEKAISRANSSGDEVLRLQESGVARDDPVWVEAGNRVREDLRAALAMCVCSSAISTSAECDEVFRLYEMFRD
jgi:hypothetical protein